MHFLFSKTWWSGDIKSLVILSFGNIDLLENCTTPGIEPGCWEWIVIKVMVTSVYLLHHGVVLCCTLPSDYQLKVRVFVDCYLAHPKVLELFKCQHITYSKRTDLIRHFLTLFGSLQLLIIHDPLAV